RRPAAASLQRKRPRRAQGWRDGIRAASSTRAGRRRTGMPAAADSRYRPCPRPRNRCAARRRDPARTPDFPRWRGDRRRRTRRTECSRTPPFPARRPAALAASAESALAPDQPRDLGALLGVVVELERLAPPDGGLGAISLLGLRVAQHLAGAGAVPPAQRGLLEHVLEARRRTGRPLGP